MLRLFFLALLVPSRFLAAQAPGPDLRCDSVLAHAERVVDSLGITVEADGRIRQIDQAALQTFAMTTGTVLQLPHPLAVPSIFYVREVPTGEGKKKSKRLVQGLRGEVMLVLDSSGAPVSAVLVQSMLDPVLDSALIAAVRQAMSYGIPQPVVDAARLNRGLALFVRLETQSGTEKAPPIDRNGRKASVVIGALRLPAIAMTRMARLRKMERPEYPGPAMAAGIEGDVLVDFVIAPDGLVAPRTLALHHASSSDFALASLHALEKAEFSPAMSDACPVALLVEQPFKFVMHREFPIP